MMIGSGGAVSAARAQGAWVVTPPTLGVGLLEFHQLDRMIEAGRAAARALLDEAGGDLTGVLQDEVELEPEGPAPTPVPAH
jgi:predicted acylesterase/phospholipase RssA